jgi:hypothetical protein
MKTQKGSKLFLVLVSAGLLLSSCGGSSSSIEPSACNCGNLYTGEYNPSNIDYSAEELNDGDKMKEDVNKFVELGKACAIKYGKLSDVEKELAEGSTSLSTIPNIDQAVDNAKAECK